MTPVDGTGFVPAGAQDPAAAGAAPAAAPAGQPQSVDAKQGLEALKQLGDEYGEPIVAANGNVYMRKKRPIVKDGRVVVSYALAAKIANGRMMVNPDFLKEQQSSAEQAKAQSARKVVKEGDRYFWQTMAPGDNGTLIAKLEPMSEEELRAYAAQVQQQEAEQGTQQWTQGKSQWIDKAYAISSKMRLVSTSGNFVNSLAAGPDPFTGRTRGNWMTGYFLVQMLDGQAEGKLLPQWMKSGPVGTALEWGMQIPFLLDMGHDLRVLGQAFPRSAALMKAFTSPTRAVLGGVASLGRTLRDTTAPTAAAAAGAGNVSLAGARRIGLAGEALEAAAQAGQSAGQAAISPAMKTALTQLGTEINAGRAAIVGAAGTNLADKVAIMSQEGLQLVPRSALQQAAKLTEAPIMGGAKIQATMTKGIHGVLGSLSPFLGMLQTGASLFGTIGGAMNLQVMVKNNGVKPLVTTKQGRSVLFSFLGSAAFLGMVMLPAVASGLGPTAAVVASGLNVASNVFQGVSMLSYGGLFGEGGYLDHDSVRAAFLIPPLTPIGLFGMWMKRKQKAAEAKQKAAEATQQKNVENLSGYMSQIAQQLQSNGGIQGGVAQADGSIILQTPFAPDGSMIPGAAPAGAPAAGSPPSAAASGGAQPSAGASQPGSVGPDARTLRMMSTRM